MAEDAKYMTDHRGAQVPLSAIKPQHLLEDELVRKTAEAAEALSNALSDFKSTALSDVDDYVEMIDREYGVARRGKKGNLTLTSFDGALQIQVAIGESLSFGAELQSAKELIDGCLTRWSDGASNNIRALVDHAFQVNKTGRIDTHRVLGLRRLDITDETGDWERAMQAISDALRIVGSKTYLRVYRRNPKTETREQIALDLASV